MQKLQARYYQRDAIESVSLCWEHHKSVILQIGTGGGKTFVCSQSIKGYLPKRSLFLADQDELCQQPLRTIQRATGIIAGLEKASHRASLDSDIVVASAQSLCRRERLERYPVDHFDMVYIDEAHRGTERDIQIANYFETALICGVTATPYKINLADLSKWYETVAYKMPLTDLAEEGFAPRFERIALPVEIDLAKVNIRNTAQGKEYDDSEMESTIEPYFDEIAELIKKHADGRFGIAYLPLIRTSIAFANCLRRHGITAYHIDGDTPNREELIESFDQGRYQWICNAGVVSTGVDIPRADCFLCLKPTRSMSWYQQAGGRIARVLPGVIDHLPEKHQAAERRRLIAQSAKPNALILDLLWLHDELGAQNSSALVCDNIEDAKRMYERRKIGEPEDLLEVAKRTQEEREAQLAKSLEQAAVKQAISTPITAQMAGLLIGDPKLISYEPTERWEVQPATEAQLSFLAKFGIDPTSITNRGMANRLQSTVFFRLQHKFATLKQLRIIARINARRPHDPIDAVKLSITDASRIIQQEFNLRRQAIATA